MTSTATATPRETGWLGPLAALALLFLVPALQPLRVVVPVEHTFLMIVPAMAVCALLGWWSGGGSVLALIWVLLAVMVLTSRLGGLSEQYAQLARGWSVLLAASFGLTCLALPARGFLARALAAIGLTVLLTLVLVLLSGRRPSELQELFTGELSARNQQSIAAFQAQVERPGLLHDMVADRPALATVNRSLNEQIQNLALRSSQVVPALAGLESLAVLALVWALFHRISRVRIGQPLPRLRDLHFNDQLIWGLLSGITLALLPTLAGLRNIGWILLVFFGGLYVLRGLGVAAWFLGRTQNRWPRAIATVAAVLLPTVAAAALLGVGVGDTWADWRKLGRPSD